MKRVYILLAIGLFLLAGCAASGPKLASSVEDIAGTWRSTFTGEEGQFNEDGTICASDPSGLVCAGKFWFEGTQFFVQEPVSCDVGNPIGIYQVELLENGNLKFTVIEDECLTRVNYVAGRVVEVEWEPVP